MRHSEVVVRSLSLSSSTLGSTDCGYKDGVTDNCQRQVNPTLSCSSSSTCKMGTVTSSSLTHFSPQVLLLLWFAHEPWPACKSSWPQTVPCHPSGVNCRVLLQNVRPVPSPYRWTARGYCSVCSFRGRRRDLRNTKLTHMENTCIIIQFEDGEKVLGMTFMWRNNMDDQDLRKGNFNL